MMKKTSQANGPKKQASTAILLSDKTDFKPKVMRIERKGYYTFIKEKKNPSCITVLCVPRNGNKIFKGEAGKAKLCCSLRRLWASMLVIVLESTISPNL